VLTAKGQLARTADGGKPKAGMGLKNKKIPGPRQLGSDNFRKPMVSPIPLRVYLQLEGLVAFIVLTLIYITNSFSFWLYAGLFFLPDLFMLGYLIDPRNGAFFYNLGHTYVIPALLVGAGLIFRLPLLVPCGLIWSAHIGFDRILGYGLKYPSGFKDTHLQKL
jgi:hypothetical protein